MYVEHFLTLFNFIVVIAIITLSVGTPNRTKLPVLRRETLTPSRHKVLSKMAFNTVRN